MISSSKTLSDDTRPFKLWYKDVKHLQNAEIISAVWHQIQQLLMFPHKWDDVA